MEKFKALVNEANKSFEVADHLAFVTYPLLNEVKLLIIIAENLFITLDKGMTALLYYDWLYKRIDNVPEGFQRKLDIFRTRTARRYNIPEEHISLIKDIYEIIQHRKKSPIEFAMKDKFVVASNNYKLRTVNLSSIKKQIALAKMFIDKVNKIKEESDLRFKFKND